MASNSELYISNDNGCLPVTDVKKFTQEPTMDGETPNRHTVGKEQESNHEDTAAADTGPCRTEANDAMPVATGNDDAADYEGLEEDVGIQQPLDNQCEETFLKQVSGLNMNDSPSSELRRRNGHPDGNEGHDPLERGFIAEGREPNPEQRQEIGHPDGDEVREPDGQSSEGERNDESEVTEVRHDIRDPDGDEATTADSGEAGREDNEREQIGANLEPNQPECNLVVHDQEKQQQEQQREPDPILRLQGKCQEVLKRFVNPNEFYKFACSSSGLKMDDTDLAYIQYCEEDEMSAMLELWLKNNHGVTCEQLDAIVAGYFAQRQIPIRNHEQGAAAQNHEEADKVRMEDVFLEVCNSFRGVTDFKKFARAAKGLRLYSADVNEIEQNHKKNSHRKMIEMLRRWRQNTTDATPQKLIEIRDRYLGFKK